MYQVYFKPGACSLAIQVVLREFQQPVNIIDKDTVTHFETINPVGTVPVLKDGDNLYQEGAAVIIHLLEKHDSHMLPKNPLQRSRAIQNIMFANATMHPAYGKLLFIAQNLPEGDVKQAALDAAAKGITRLWNVVESRLGDQPYLGGNEPSAADILLTVYSRWGQFFPVDIRIGERAQNMIDAVLKRPTFIAALQAEDDVNQVAA